MGKQMTVSRFRDKALKRDTEAIAGGFAEHNERLSQILQSLERSPEGELSWQ
jgi:hypothetical protein